jgi:hypothetical protein
MLHPRIGVGPVQAAIQEDEGVAGSQFGDPETVGREALAEEPVVELAVVLQGVQSMADKFQPGAVAAAIVQWDPAGKEAGHRQRRGGIRAVRHAQAAILMPAIGLVVARRMGRGKSLAHPGLVQIASHGSGHGLVENRLQAAELGKELLVRGNGLNA